MRTNEISFQLRTWAERIRNSQRKNCELLNAAADRLDELDERIAIMTEHEYDGDITFPPLNNELDINNTFTNTLNNTEQKEGD